MDEPLSRAAHVYARMGIPVLPLHTPSPEGCSCPERADCTSPGKHPRTKPGLIMAGVSDASTDPDVIIRWWQAWPDANVGVQTGTHIDVCDVDTRDGLNMVLAITKDQPLGPVVATGAGGWHLWYTATGHGNRVNLLNGVDWRGRRGYAVAPPSLHPSGHRYLWLRPPHTPLTSAPLDLSALLNPPQPSISDNAPVRHPSAYIAAAIDAEVTRVLAAPRPSVGARGQRNPGARNNTLNVAAFNLGQLVGAGLIDQHTVKYHLLVAARQSGLNHHESVATIRSGLSAGRRLLRSRRPSQPS